MTGNTLRERKGKAKNSEDDNLNSTKNSKDDLKSDKDFIEENSTGTDKQQKKKRGKSKSSKDTLWSCLSLSSICNKLKYVCLIFFIPPFLNYASLQKETVELKPEGGERYDIGWGQKLFMSCQGKGPLTVVLDAPTGMTSDVWEMVVKGLVKQARVCVYDRAGLGFSDRPVNRSSLPASESQGQDQSQQQENRWQEFTVERMASDLHRLVTSSSQQPHPLILVGAELGAVVAQFTAGLFGSEVAGLVLVNPLPDELFSQQDSAWSDHWQGSISPGWQSLQLLAAVGLTRLGLLVGFLPPPVASSSLSPEAQTRQKHLLCHPRHLASVVDEHHFTPESLAQLRTLRRLRPPPANLTTTVLTGNYYDETMPPRLNKAWAVAESSLLSRWFPSAQHLVVNGADRHLPYRKPEPIIEAVLRIIRRWKKSNKAKATKGSSSS